MRESDVPKMTKGYGSLKQPERKEQERQKTMPTSEMGIDMTIQKVNSSSRNSLES
jgi:hypothetical protein